MTKPKPDKPFVEGLSIAGLLADKEPKTEAKAPARRPGWYDYQTEILDSEEGWIYEKLRRNKKGKKLRKVFESLHGGWDREGITFWKPKLNDLAFCEAKRWMAVQYQKNQYPKITGVFEDALKNTPFCCIRMTKEAPVSLGNGGKATTNAETKKNILNDPIANSDRILVTHGSPTKNDPDKSENESASSSSFSTKHSKNDIAMTTIAITDTTNTKRNSSSMVGNTSLVKPMVDPSE